MPVTGRTRATRASDEDEAVRRPAPEPDAEETAGLPTVPNLAGGPLEPDAWLALQQTIGNSAVGGLVERRRASQPLPPEARHDMEDAFGQDFGQVQVHSGPDVDQAAQALDAAAFTVGDDIYLHSALPGFDDPFGRQVLGEELAHVAQGVGRAGSSRLTAPSEAAEREAHKAGEAAASGRRVEVGAAPEAAGAVARFDASEELKKLYDWAVGGTETATREKKAEKTELSDEEKDRLKAGALDPLSALYGQLVGKVAAQAGRIAPWELTPVADAAAGISKFILSFNGPPAIQPTIEAAVESTAAGRNAIIAATNPASIISDVADALGNTASEIDGLTVAPAPAGGQERASDTESLTTAEAEQLKTGAAEPVRNCAEQLKGKGDGVSGEVVELALSRLRSIPALLHSFTKPAAIVPQLRRKALSIEVDVRALQAALDGPVGAVNDAIVEWASALGLLGGLTAKSSAGGGTQEFEGPSAGADDDDKPKDK